MKIRIPLFLLGFFLVIVPVFSQCTTPLPSNCLLLAKTQAKPSFKKPFLYLPALNKPSKGTPDLQFLILNRQAVSVPSSYCTADLAFFCRLEVQMEKATKIPVRFRLGDVQYVDYLEGKHEGWRYNH